MSMTIEEKRALVVSKIKDLGLDPSKPMDLKQLSEAILAKKAASEPGFAKKADAAAAGVLRGATLGVSDPVIAGMRGVYEAGKGTLTGDPRSLAEMYKAGFEHGKEQLKAYKEEMPSLSTVSEFAGAIVPSPINLGGKIVKGAQLGREAVIGAKALKEAPLASKMLAGAATGGAAGAGIGMVENVADAAMGESGPDLLRSAGVGAAVEGALPALGALGRAAGKAVPGALGFASGKSKAFVKDFVDDAENIMAAPSKEQFKATVENAYNKAAQRAVDITDKLTKTIQSAVEAQPKYVRELSGESYKILDKPEYADLFISKAKLVNPLGDALEKISIGGVVPDIGEAKGVFSELQKTYEAIKSLPKNIPVRDAKKLIQLLDSAVSTYGADPKFKNSAADKAIMQIRGTLNDRLRSKVKEYADFMDTRVRPATEHSRWLDSNLGTTAKIKSYLGRVRKEVALGQSTRLQNEMLSSIAGSYDGHVAGVNIPGLSRQESAEAVADSISDLYKQMRATAGERDSLAGKIDGFMNTFTSRAESANPLKKQLLAMSSLPDGNLAELADRVAMREAYLGIGQEPISAKRLWDAFAYWGTGGYLVASATGINPLAASLAVGLSRLYSPGVAKSIMGQLAMVDGMPTVKAIQGMAIPADVKSSLVAGLVNSLNESSGRGKPMPVNNLTTGVQINQFIKKGDDPIAKAKALTQLHKDKTVDSETMRKWILDGADPEGMMADYFASRGVPSAHLPFLAGESEPEQQAETAVDPRNKWSDRIAQLEKQHGFPDGLLTALVKQESGFNKSIKSKVGALGLTQLMEGTARDLGLRVGRGVDERLDPNKNLSAGAQYLRDQIEDFGDVRLALAAYNAGPARVRSALKEADGDVEKAISLLPEETRKYIPAIMGQPAIVKE